MSRKRGLQFAMCLAAIAVFTMTASAQTTTVSANVPFEFSIGSHTYPAGQYTLTPHPNFANGWVIASGRHRAVVVAVPERARQEKEQPRLSFRRYGSQSFLGELCTSGSDRVLIFEESRQERAVARQNGRPVTQTVAVR